MNIIPRNWKEHTIRQREDGFFCLTDMAKANGKQFRDWNRLEKTQEYLKILSQRRCADSHNGEWMEIIQGGEPKHQGTWGHRKIALRFAQWLNPEFAIQVDEWVEELLTKGYTSLTELSPAELILKQAQQLVDVERRQKEIEKQQQIQEQQTQRLTEQVTHMDGELDRIFKPDGDYYTIRGYGKLKGINLTLSEANSLGRKAAKLSEEQGYKLDKLPDPRYGKVNAYSEYVLEQLFSNN